MEGGDRNISIYRETYFVTGSPSSWRAWIEIRGLALCRKGRTVALLMEGVDRNIEYGFNSDASGVALLMEGVDRNLVYLSATDEQRGRPPHGGRG